MEEDAMVPVFTSTGEIEFALNERSPRQVVTLYNPYGYLIQYKVLCTAPSNYVVAEANGLLQGKCCKDIVIRCNSRLPVGCIDKLRVEIRKRGESQIHGFRDILMKTVAERSPESTTGKSSFYGMSESMSASRSDENRRVNETSMWWCILIAVFCAVALALPTTLDPSAHESMVPPSLHLSLPQKLVASFILGATTILILRPL